MKRRKGKWNASAPAVENARRELPLFAGLYFKAGRKVSRPGAPARKLHQFRLVTKHFRYLLELFRPLYGPRLDVCLMRLRRLQGLLGDLNDYEVTRQMLAGEADAPGVLAWLKRQDQRKRAEFRRYWEEEFAKAGEQKRWQAYLRQFAGRGRQLSG
ncbi:MAG: CHAD domain-containing protein [Acidobacteria bacterium]|nr:CHAD domain-containing protein [Acidobacteriota bacterium]